VGEFVVGELELLQAEGIDRVGRQPLEHLGQTHGKGIDVPGGNFHFYKNSFIFNELIDIFLNF
jgi:hypothetical protein